MSALNDYNLLAELLNQDKDPDSDKIDRTRKNSDSNKVEISRHFTSQQETRSINGIPYMVRGINYPTGNPYAPARSNIPARPNSPTRYKDGDIEPSTSHGICYDQDPDSIFSNENLAEGIDDFRKIPEWNIAYRQVVTPNDVFLQMDGKTPSTTSCEDIILKVFLPGERKDNLILKVEKTYVDIFSPNYKLKVILPHNIDPEVGNASFEQSSGTLKLVLRIVRDTFNISRNN